MICRIFIHGWLSGMLLIFARRRLMQILTGLKILEEDISTWKSGISVGVVESLALSGM